ELNLAPPQDGRIVAYPRVAVYDSGEANADPHDLGARKVRCVQDLLDSPADGRDGCLWVLHTLHGGQPVMEYIGFQVSQGADDGPLGQLQPHDEPGARVQFEQDPRPPSRRRSCADLLDKARRQKSIGETGDRGWAETGEPGDFGAREWASALDQVEGNAVVDLLDQVTVSGVHRCSTLSRFSPTAYFTN